MDRAEALIALQRVVGEVVGIDPSVVVETARFREDLRADSLDLIEIVTAVEDQTGVRIPDEQLKNIATVGHALDLVASGTMVGQ